MPQNKELVSHFEAYADWRRRLSAAISSYHDWLAGEELVDAQVDLQFQQLLERLHQDKLVVAFVAEFSRGKSELINAIFFRLRPAAAALFGGTHHHVSDGTAVRCLQATFHTPVAYRNQDPRRLGRGIQELRG